MCEVKQMVAKSLIGANRAHLAGKWRLTPSFLGRPLP